MQNNQITNEAGSEKIADKLESVQWNSAIKSHGLDPAIFIDLQMQFIKTNKDLYDIAINKNHNAYPALVNALLQCARDGLLIDGKEAHLQTYYSTKLNKHVLSLIDTAFGYHILANRKNIGLSAIAVRECDNIFLSETDGMLIKEQYELKLEKNVLIRRKSKIVGWYGAAYKLDTKEVIHTDFLMIEDIQSRYMKQLKNDTGADREDAPWKKHFDKMCEKTIIKIVAKGLHLKTHVGDYTDYNDESQQPAESTVGGTAVPGFTKSRPVQDESKVIDVVAAEAPTVATKEEIPNFLKKDKDSGKKNNVAKQKPASETNVATVEQSVTDTNQSNDAPAITVPTETNKQPEPDINSETVTESVTGLEFL